MAGQSSALRWAYEHRIHHAYVDTDKDPYSIKKGFWYAHFLWMIEGSREIESKVVPDLLQNKRIMFQYRHNGKCMFFTNAIAFFVVGWLLGDYVGAFFLALWSRLFVLHHFTWFINSLAHTWGDRPFSQEQSAVDNYIISMLTFGEGYHNYHHTFANDYRNGVRWFHFDPTKWLIWTLHKLGLVHDLKKMSQEAIRKRMVVTHKKLLLERLSDYCHHKKDDLEQQINHVAERLVAQMSALNQLKEQYRQLKKMPSSQDLLDSLGKQLNDLKKNLQSDWEQWSQLSNNILGWRPAKT